MLGAVCPRMRSPMVARMIELTDRKNVLTCCRRETRDSEVPTKSLYCSSSAEASASLNSSELCSPKSSCSTVFGSDAIQLTHYSLDIPRQGGHVKCRNSGRNSQRRRLKETAMTCLPSSALFLISQSTALLRCVVPPIKQSVTLQARMSRSAFVFQACSNVSLIE